MKRARYSGTGFQPWAEAWCQQLTSGLSHHDTRHHHFLSHFLCRQEPLYIECLVCGRVYGAGAPAPPRAPPPPPAGTQPPGSMAWRLQYAPLPQQDTNTSILVTYK